MSLLKELLLYILVGGSIQRVFLEQRQICNGPYWLPLGLVPLSVPNYFLNNYAHLSLSLMHCVVYVHVLIYLVLVFLLRIFILFLRLTVNCYKNARECNDCLCYLSVYDYEVPVKD